MPTMTAPNAGKTATFKIHSNGAVKAVVRKDALGEDQYYVEGIASSNVRDRHGDTITTQAQASMLEQAKGLTMFLNHSYDVPEDVFGTCEESALETNGDIVDLVIRCKVAKSNPRAMKSWQLIKQDEVTLGFSIGGNLTEYDVDEENDDGTSWCPPLIINGIELFEISLCGVPANPRSYTRDFVSQISRGFMRSAARSPEVRDLVRKTLMNSKPDPDLAKLLDESVGDTAGGSADGAAQAATAAPDSAADAVATVTADDHSVPPGSADVAVPDVECGADTTVTVALDVDTTTATAQIAQLQTQADTLKTHVDELNDAIKTQVSERDAIAAEIGTLTDERDRIKAETAELVKALAELKATPTGRLSKTATSGGSSGNGTALGGIDLTKLTTPELLEYKRRVASGHVFVDGRDRAS